MGVVTAIVQLSRSANHPDLPGPELLPARVMRAAAAVLPVTAAGISAFTKFRHRVPLGASDDTAALAERLQFTVGEGPCLSAHAQMEPIVAVAQVMAVRWPAFHGELLSHTPYRSIFSIPIQEHGLGSEAALDLYYDQPVLVLDEQERQDIEDATDVITALLMGGSGLQDPLVAGPVWLNNEPVHARTLVWTAIGMINVAFELDSPDALPILPAYAYGHNSTIDDIAHDLTTRTLPVEALLA